MIDQETAWKQLLVRDPAATIFYAVTTTGVFCRPGCKSRRPLRENVRFFRSAQDAQTAGFRACMRCKPTAPRGGPLDKIRSHIEANIDRAVPLAELGRVTGLSPFTVQRMFKQQLGVSPLQYQRALRAGGLRNALKQGGTVTNAIYEAGFGSSSRAYEGAALGMTPARFADRLVHGTFTFWMDRGGLNRTRVVLAGAWVHIGGGRGQLARRVSAGRASPRSVAVAACGSSS